MMHKSSTPIRSDLTFPTLLLAFTLVIPLWVVLLWTASWMVPLLLSETL